MPDFYKRLLVQRKTILFVILMAFTMAVFGAASILIVGFDLLNKLSPWHEASAFYGAAAVSVSAWIILFVGVVAIFLRRPKLTYLAQLVENKNPALMESLTCAVEILEQAGEPRNPIEAALVRQVEAETESLNFTTTILPQKLHPLIIILLGMGMLIFSDMAMRSELAQKASFHFKDLIAGEATGLVVYPQDSEQPIGEDLTIFATIHRWQQQAKIVYREQGEEQTYNMSMNLEGNTEFTFYGLQHPIEYRVETPSLQSPWYEIAVYQPPKIESIHIDIKPPSYTREEPRQFGKLLDLFVTEGSAIQVMIEVEPGITGAVIHDKKIVPLKLWEGAELFEPTDASNPIFVATLEPKVSGQYQIKLLNEEGRVHVTETHEIEVIPDEKPVVQIIEPGKDIESGIDEVIPLEIYTADDYGINRVEIHISVSGLPREPIVVYPGSSEVIQEENFFSMLELEGLGVEYGDIVTYHAVVWDNKEPEANEVHSDVFFIEIQTEEIPPSEQLPMPGQGGGEEEEVEIDFRAIVTELKRLIRLSHEAQFYEGEERKLSLQDIGAALSELHSESSAFLNKIAQTIMDVENGQIFIMFREALERMKQAEELVNTDFPDEAIPPKEEALSKILNVERYFQSQQPPSQGQGQGESQSTAENEGESDESEASDSGMSLGEMQAALEDINGLIDRQSAMNNRFDQASEANLGEQERQELSDLQADIAQETNALRRSMGKDENADFVARELDNANQEMGQSVRSTKQNEMAQAGRYGARAKEDLLTASSLMSELIREQANQAVANMASAAQGLAMAQQQAAEASAQAQSGQGDQTNLELKEEQEALQDSLQSLQQDMDRTAVELEASFPEVGRALSAIARETESKNLDGKMQKASNALLYERYKSAQSSQERAAESLGELAQQLNAAKENLPALSAQELQALLEQVLSARERMAQAEQQAGQSEQEQAGEGEQPGEQSGEGEGEGEGQQPSEQAGQGGSGGQGEDGEEGTGGMMAGTGDEKLDAMERVRQDVGEKLAAAGQMMKDRELAKLGSELEAPTQGEGGNTGEANTELLLQQSARILQQYLREQWVSERSRLNQRSAAPPEKYRRMVEEYFKKLAEEE